MQPVLRDSEVDTDSGTPRGAERLSKAAPPPLTAIRGSVGMSLNTGQRG